MNNPEYEPDLTLQSFLGVHSWRDCFAGSADGAVPATITAVRDDVSGVGLTIASVQPAGEDQGESSHGEVFIDSAGNVGLGITDPTDRA